MTKLSASEASFRTFVDNAADAFFLLNDQSTVLNVNRQACVSLGYSREELIGKHQRDFDITLDEASIECLKQRIMAGEAITFETCHRRKDGTSFPVEIRVAQIEKDRRRFVCVARDITERKRAEEVLRESEARLQKAQRVAHFGWWERDFTTNHVSLSDEVRRIFGLQPVDLPDWQARWLQLIHPEDRPRIAEAAAAALLPGGSSYDVEYRVVRPDGAERVVHSRGDVTWNDSGRPVRQFGVLQDITELRQAERELRASEVRFRTFVDHATDAFLLLDDDWTILDVNRQACVGLGYGRAELIGKHKGDFDIGLDRAAIQRLKQRTVAGEAINFETRHRRKDGTSFPVEVRVNQFEQGGRRFLCLARDITERKRAEDELRASEVRFRTLVQFSFDVYWETDQQHRFIRQEFAEGLADAPPRAPKSARLAGKCLTSSLMPRRGASTARPLMPTFRSETSSSRGLRPTAASATCPSLGCRYLIRRDALWATAASGDTSAQKKAEKALRRSEAYLAEAQRLSRTGTLAFNASTALYWSEESYRIWGLDPLQGLPVAKLSCSGYIQMIAREHISKPRRPCVRKGTSHSSSESQCPMER